MKLLIALGFFASAIALATPPIEEFHKQDHVSVSDFQRDLQDVSIKTTRQEPEFKSLAKRVTSYLDTKLPLNPASMNFGLNCLGVTMGFVLTATGQWASRNGRIVHGVLCQEVLLFNTLDRAVWVTLKTLRDTVLCETVFLAAHSVKHIPNMKPFSGRTVRLWVTDTARFSRSPDNNN